MNDKKKTGLCKEDKEAMKHQMNRVWLSKEVRNEEVESTAPKMTETPGRVM